MIIRKNAHSQEQPRPDYSGSFQKPDGIYGMRKGIRRWRWPAIRPGENAGALSPCAMSRLGLLIYSAQDLSRGHW